ncbi:MAG: hypothetical protein IJ355_06515 [Prevotella sp.]|nr:hypothetical protein [Prevotella sp.]
MRQILFFLFIVLFCADCKAQTVEAAQDSIEITFAVVTPKECSLTSVQRKELKLMLEKVLARTQSAGVPNRTPFVIVPDVTVKTIDTTSGAKETFTLIDGELSLVVKNQYDGSVYNEITIPLKELTETGRVDDPKLVLIRKINPRDRQFVRFVRTTKDRIAGKYSGKVVDVP